MVQIRLFLGISALEICSRGSVCTRGKEVQRTFGKYVGVHIRLLMRHWLLRVRLDSLSLPVTSNALHPGLVATNLLANANAFKNQGITPAEGALTSIYLATSPEVAGKSGGYYQRSKPVLLGGDRTEISASLVEGQRLWTAACNELGLSEEL
jgi:hypothetical protein